MRCIFAFCLAPGDNWILDKEVIIHMPLKRLPCHVNQSAPKEIDQWDTSRSRMFHLPIPSIGLLSQGWCWAGAQPNILEHAWNVKKAQNSPPQRSLSRCKSDLFNKLSFQVLTILLCPTRTYSRQPIAQRSFYIAFTRSATMCCTRVIDFHLRSTPPRPNPTTSAAAPHTTWQSQCPLNRQKPCRHYTYPMENHFLTQCDCACTTFALWVSHIPPRFKYRLIQSVSHCDLATVLCRTRLIKHGSTPRTAEKRRECRCWCKWCDSYSDRGLDNRDWGIRVEILDSKAGSDDGKSSCECHIMFFEIHY